MFSKSLGSNKFTTQRKIIGFNERNNPKFKPSKEKEVRIYSPNVIKSQKSDKLKFTNFYASHTDGAIINRLSELSSDLDVIKSGNIEMDVYFNDNRIESIIKLFIVDFDIDNLGQDKVRKVTLIDPFGMKGQVRVYFIISNDFNSYEIIAIDLFHLLIPSSHNGKSSEQMLNSTYESNKNNNKCLTDMFLG